LSEATYLTSQEIADELRISDDSVNRWCRQGKFPGAVKAGKAWRIPRGDFEGWKKSQQKAEVDL